jgi:hypothetical protein
LLDFSKPASNKFIKLFLNQTIKIALELTKEQIKSNGVELNIDLAKKLPKIYGNTEKLTVLWANLFILARDSTNDDLPHTIHIQSGRDGDILYAQIHDDGSIIPVDDLINILEPNFLKSLGGRGSGIEFNACQEIVRQHHGEMQVSSNPVKGSFFRVNIPLEAIYETL